MPKQKSKRPNGLIIYDGKSLIDGEPIVCIVTGFNKTQNKKTGQTLQSWILRSDIHPHEAITSGKDESICGNCMHRGKYDEDKGRMTERSCYVKVLHGPSPVYRAYKRGSYEKLSDAHLPMFKDRILRAGSYGEPTALPISVWQPLIEQSKSVLCYTHRWKDCDPRWSNYSMASVDSEEERLEALSNGWRTFRVRTPEQPLMKGEFVCPASEEEGFRLQCEDCKSCRGWYDFSDSAREKGRSASPVIMAHGVSKVHFVKLTKNKEAIGVSA